SIFLTRPIQGSTELLSGWGCRGPAAPRRVLITIQCIDLPALCKSKKTPGADSVNAWAQRTLLPAILFGHFRATFRHLSALPDASDNFGSAGGGASLDLAIRQMFK